ncbi:extracellular solute-binding protein [Paenibacillus sp. GD4]|jgi:multiple sugar transport system substrate-binding protein|uniref:ABC transporter substrate-binding protein n=1 Tax=Paenibacillus TaxID=44249 RepID=UPI0025438C09|nr:MULTISPECIES: extracellular solute-binding protein [Paenibacillus]MDQ1912599.1 extracellular solute-binding protein [Paenibacillus sp. GD4]
MNWRKIGIVSLCTAFLLAGCTGGDAGAPQATQDNKEAVKISTEPVTVKFATSRGIFTDVEFKKYVQDPLAKKYPHITAEYINTSEKGFGITELVAAGSIPDIIVGYGGTLKQLKELRLLSNMDPLIKKHNLDLNRIIPETLSYIKVNADTDYLGGLPIFNNTFALFYNKALFDKFGVPYPKDGMTWEEAGDLGRQMTRVYDGVQYRGFYPDNVNRMINQIVLYQLDKNNNHKSTLTTEPWKEAFELWNRIYNYPGNADAPYDTMNFAPNQEAFLKGELAMIAGFSSTLLALRQAKEMSWDVVTYPQHKKNMGYSTNVDTPNMSITEQSKVKDAAFQVIETILSDEVQLELARNAKMSILSSEVVKQEYGKGIPEFAGKSLNLTSMVKLKPSVPSISKYQGSDTNKIVLDAYDLVLKKEKDINTALREADEQLTKLVEFKKQNGQ